MNQNGYYKVVCSSKSVTKRDVRAAWQKNRVTNDFEGDRISKSLASRISANDPFAEVGAFCDHPSMLTPLVISLLAFFSVANIGQQGWDDRTAFIYATVQHSEWCPAGNVQLDLRTGEFVLTERADRENCQDPDIERPNHKGKLDESDLQALRGLFELARSEGLEATVCREGGKPDYIIISNGGLRTLVVTTGAYTESAPDRLECWSEAAKSLRVSLETIFDPSREGPSV